MATKRLEGVWEEAESGKALAICSLAFDRAVLVWVCPKYTLPVPPLVSASPQNGAMMVSRTGNGAGMSLVTSLSTDKNPFVCTYIIKVKRMLLMIKSE